MPILEVSGYTKNFHIHHLDREIAVFQNLEFTLHAGEFLLVAGPNGIGKSTLLRCLYRSYRPTAGKARYHSTYGVIDLARAADVDMGVLRREEIGFVTQFLRPRPRVSALELVAETVADSDGQSGRASAEAMLLEFGLKPELWHAYPATFSGGEQQKVNLARALIRPRRLLLLDEPTASLDAATRDSLARKLAELKAQGVAMIGVFHHPEDVAHLIDDEIRLSSSALSVNGQGAAYDVVE
ncbi:MAG TPA: ATP-binding cassette domain-containing protein [Phototrophicaceae bacterium]|nr:ATP-binding cassette domain-containing protein [Phototrophicaceae bacterium]